MADEEEKKTNEEGAEGNTEVAKSEQKKFPLNKKQLTYIGAGVGALLVGLGIYLSPLPTVVKSLLSPKNEKTDLLELAFLSLPEMIVNLKSTKSRGNILKTIFVLEIESLAEKEKIDHLKPLIIDQFQSYLRELEANDIQGAAGMERVRQELFNRVNTIITPLKIRQILVKDFLIQ